MRIRQFPRPNITQVVTVLAVLAVAVGLLGLLVTYALSRRTQDTAWWSAPRQATQSAPKAADPTTAVLGLPTRRPPDAPFYTPTPDAPHALPTLRADPESYMVQAGDSLGSIAARYGVSWEMIAEENQIANPDLLAIGQVLSIPAPTPAGLSPGFKVIPDSELVYGPASVLFDVEAFIREQGGFLASYTEEVGEQVMSGAQIVQRIAQDYSINPRLLLAVLQHQAGWVTGPTPDKKRQEYPLGFPDTQRKGLFRQLSWAANQLNRGYYLYRVNGAAAWLLSDGSIVPIDPTINAGTAGVQQLFALLYNRAGWEQAVSAQGLFATYQTMFGYAFDYAIDPLLPVGLAQPAMQLPFEPDVSWAFTSGPHGAWGDGAAWGALDFAPADDRLGCVLSNLWVVAVADGQILRAGDGAVIQELDNDGHEQTGWVVLYMHIESRERVQPGVTLKAGERIGHPSCEGGVSTGTHMHLARRYNGEWIPADQGIPFVLDGWVSSGAGVEYDGYLQRGARRIEAYAGHKPENEIQR